MVPGCVGSEGSCLNISDDEWPVKLSTQVEVQGETLSAKCRDRHPIGCLHQENLFTKRLVVMLFWNNGEYGAGVHQETGFSTKIRHVKTALRVSVDVGLRVQRRRPHVALSYGTEFGMIPIVTGPWIWASLGRTGGFVV